MKRLNLPPVWLIGFMAAAWGLARLWAPLGEALVWIDVAVADEDLRHAARHLGGGARLF